MDALQWYHKLFFPLKKVGWNITLHSFPHCTIRYKYAPHCTIRYKYAPHCTIRYKYAPHCTISYTYAPHCTIRYTYAPHCTIRYKYAPHWLHDGARFCLVIFWSSSLHLLSIYTVITPASHPTSDLSPDVSYMAEFFIQFLQRNAWVLHTSHLTIRNRHGYNCVSEKSSRNSFTSTVPSASFINISIHPHRQVPNSRR
jgi:hypothetical protein